ncbi:MAG TPA: NAD(P)-binding domain-containing protein [Stellaceae bacterium]|jgi:opine dehydrogenase
MDRAKTIAVIGAGNGGFNLAAHLGAAGHRMRLHDIDDAKLTVLRAAGGIDTSGMGTGFAKLDRVTTDLAEAVDGAEIIVVCTGGHRQTAVAKSSATLLADGQTILLV